jgi:PD-(D/E)XK nuclease superfamily
MKQNRLKAGWQGVFSGFPQSRGIAKAIDEIHLAQCLNYLKATGLHLCLLLNFGKPRLEIKRIVLAL